MKLNELLEKYAKTMEDITFDMEGLSDEELEAKFQEVFGEEAPSEEAGEASTENMEENKEPETEKTTEESAEEASEEETQETEEPVVEENSVHNTTKKFSDHINNKDYLFDLLSMRQSMLWKP